MYVVALTPAWEASPLIAACLKDNVEQHDQSSVQYGLMLSNETNVQWTHPELQMLDYSMEVSM